MTRAELMEILEAREAQVVTFDGLDDAMVGVTTGGTEELHVVYSREKCIQALMQQGMTREEAVDWFEYNTLRTIPYAGVNHPIIIEP